MSRPAGVVDGLLAGRYRLASPLGAGPAVHVWRARDERLDRDVAVEVLRPELADDPAARARFRAAARRAQGLHHPAAPAVLDVAGQDGDAWLVRELVDGPALSDVLRRHGRLPVPRTLDVVEQVATVLQAAHDSGVPHGRITPEELLVGPDGRVSVTGFGAAAVAATRTDAASDLRSLGMVAVECLCGTAPLTRDAAGATSPGARRTPPPALPDDVPRPVADLVLRLLAEDPAGRPPSAGEVAQQAAALRRGLAPGAPRTGVPLTPDAARPARPVASSLAERPGQRRAVRATAVLLALLALAVGTRDALGDGPSTPAGVQQDDRPQPEERGSSG